MVELRGELELTLFLRLVFPTLHHKGNKVS